MNKLFKKYPVSHGGRVPKLCSRMGRGGTRPCQPPALRHYHKNYLSVLALFMTLQLFAAVDDHWDDQFGSPGVDSGTVYAITQSGTNVYIGGSFAAVGESEVGGSCALDLSN